LAVSYDTVIERMSGRLLDPLTGKNYHKIHNPPPATVEHRVVSRDDDTLEKVKVRLAAYHKAKESIMTFYGKLVATIIVGRNDLSDFPPDVKPLLVFDKVREALEGDTYWGSVVRSELMAKDFDCGSSATSLQAIAQYFQHSRFRMLWHGCLAEASAKCSRVSLRAQVVTMAIPLQPLQKYKLKTWLESVSQHSVVLSHTISQQLADGRVQDVARGSAVLVFTGESGETLQIPRARQIRDLIDPVTAMKGHKAVNVIAQPSPQMIKEMIGQRAAVCWSCAFYVSADEMDSHGVVRETACISYFERIRMNAAGEGGYGDIDGRSLLLGRTVRIYVAYRGFSTQGDRLQGYTWIVSSTNVRGQPKACIDLAFEICDTSGSVQVRGCLLVQPWMEIGAQARL